MKQKIYVLIMTLLTLFASLAAPQNIYVLADEDYGDPNIDHGDIFNNIKNLSDIILNDLYKDRGRYFGTDGERYATLLIKDWMNQIDLDSVHNETIDAFWTRLDEKVLFGDVSLYTGFLNKSRVMKTYFIKITIYNSTTWSIIEYKNLSGSACYPSFLYQFNIFNTTRTESGYNVSVREDFNNRCSEEQMELAYTTWTNPYHLFEKALNITRLRKNYRGIIAIDNNTDTYFMPPPCYDQMSILYSFLDTQIFYVNKSIGTWIKNAIDNNYTVKADFYTHWERENVSSYNVIGQINGSDPDPKNVSIVCAHYDNMWNQGTIDEGAETALVLGIAKYIKDHELENKLKQTVKFIAFGGEEPGIRGSKDYIKDNIINPTNGKENVTYVINPGNFGHYSRNYSDYNNIPNATKFEFNSVESWLANLSIDIADAMSYTPRTNQTGPAITTKPFTEHLRAEDSSIFGNSGSAYACIQFGRSPFEGYHSDGVDHTKGDTLDILDNDTFNLESEVVASVTLHLLLDFNFSIVNYSKTVFDNPSDGDANTDSVKIYFNITSDTNTSLFGNVTGCLYNMTTNTPVSNLVYTGLIPLIKDENTSGNLTLTLYSDVKPDNYYANLTLIDVFGNTHDICSQIVNLNPYGNPMADFSWEYYLIYKMVNFTDESIPSFGAYITSWNWSFGDGNYSEVQNPSHQYTFAGVYNVTLTIVDSNSLSANVTKQVLVIDLMPDASFNTDSYVQKVDNNVRFVSTSTDSDGCIVNTTWFFGDGSIGYGNETDHAYNYGGLFTVVLKVKDNDGVTNSTTGSVLIANEYVNTNYQKDNSSSGNWTTIQAAVDNASNNGYIYVFNGTYSNGSNCIVIDKELSLYGEGNVIVNAEGTAVDIKCNNVKIDGFIVENSNTGILISNVTNINITDTLVSNSTFGIKMEKQANYNMISNCELKNNTFGILISESVNNLVGAIDVTNPVWDDCIFKYNSYGVYITGESFDNYIMGCTINATPPDPYPQTPPSCIYIDNSVSNVIVFCNLTNADGYGIYLSGALSNSIIYNKIKGNSKGVYLSGSSMNNIIGNNISDNTQSGVNILTMSSSSNNIIFNNFIDNGGVLYPQASDSGIGNLWNTSDYNTYMYNSSGEGNFWSDYSGSDRDGNGIGDTSYSIGGIAGSSDFYPVMESYGWFYILN